MRNSLASEIPLWNYSEEKCPHVVLSDGSICAGLEVELKDIESLDNQAVNDFVHLSRNCLNSLEEGIHIQFYFKVDSDFKELIESHESKISTSAHPFVKALATGRVGRLKDDLASGALYRPRLYVFVRLSPNFDLKKNLFATEGEFQAGATEKFDELVDQLLQGREALAQGFSQMGLASIPLSTREMRNLLYQFLNPSRSKEFEINDQREFDHAISDEGILNGLPWLRDESPRSQMVFGDLVLSHQGFVLDGYSHRIVTLKSMPETTFAGQMHGILNLPFHFDLFLTIFNPVQADEMESLKRRRRMAHSLAAGSSGGVSDLESETKLNSTEELLRELLNTGQKLFAAQLQIVLKRSVTAEKQLNRDVKEVISAIRGLSGADALEEQVGAWPITKGNLPSLPIKMERPFKMKTNNLADFLPMLGPKIGDNDPVVLLKNRLGGLASIDSFDSSLSNFNTLVTGSSGAGKSFLNNCIVLQELARNQRIFIIDIGGSYKKLTRVLGGQYFDLTIDACLKFNPFHLDNPVAKPSDQKLKMVQACIESMITEPGEKLLKLDRVKLEKVIHQIFDKARESGQSATLSDLEAELLSSADSSLKDLGVLLYSWTKDRPYGKILDGFGSFSSDARVCTFDLKGLSSHPELQRVLVLLLTDFILNEVEKDKSQRKRIILDEAWELLKSSSAANFMEYCARTLRKTGSGITFITQGVEEIVASPIGPAILNNTATKLVLLQRGDTSVLKNALKLNEREISLIQSLEQRKGKFSEAFFLRSDRAQVLRISPSPIEYWLSTSDAKDNAYLLGLEKNLGLEGALKEAAENFPFGLGGKEVPA